MGGGWITATNATTVTTTWNVGKDGEDLPIYLGLRDVEGNQRTVVKGTVDVDTIPPSSTLTLLPDTSSPAWIGSDETSGIAGYDVQVREGIGGEWVEVMNNTTELSTTYVGKIVRRIISGCARDVAGHVEEWPDTYDTKKDVTILSLTGGLLINDGALVTTYEDVLLSMRYDNKLDNQVEVQFHNEGEEEWGDWQLYASDDPYAKDSFEWTLPVSDGEKLVWARFRDDSGVLPGVLSSIGQSHLSIPTSEQGRHHQVQRGSAWL